MKDWTKSFFRPEVFTPGNAEAMAAAPAEAARLWKVLKLRRGSRVLDLCCGTGRHAVPLARRGASVLGVDKTAAYLERAVAAAKGLKNCRFVRGDMRRLPYKEEFDAAYNLWTSFGYFATPAEDQKVLDGVARSLKPGGLFLIELVDLAWVRKRTSQRYWTREADGSYMLQEAVLIEGRDPRVLNEWTFLRRGERPRRTNFTLRGYDEKRLSACLRKAGLKPVTVWDALVGAAPKRKFNGRLVILAKKPR